MIHGGRVCVASERIDAPVMVLDCPALPGCVVFAASNADAGAVFHGGGDARIRAALHGEFALIWVSDGGAQAASILLDTSGRVARDAEFTAGSVALRIGAGAMVEAGSSDGQYVIRASEGNITFGSSPVTSDVEIRGGVLSFTGSLSGPLATPPSVRYFYSANQGVINGFQYPIFSPIGGGAMAIRAILSPSYPLDPQRNEIAFLSGDSTPTHFSTVTGEQVQLGIIPDRSSIVPQWDPAQQAIYYAPAGDWLLSVPGATGFIEVMCGLSGLEYARVSDASILRFVPGAPSFAPSFPSATAGVPPQSLTSGFPGSTLPVTTSWAYFAENDPSLRPAPGAPGPQGYYSQPDHGGLFQPDLIDPFLGILQLQTGVFPPTAKPVFGAPKPSFPMAPYGGVSAAGASASELYAQFEVEVLSTTRNNAIYEMNFQQSGPQGGMPFFAPAAFAGATYNMAVTPQGMLSTFSLDYSVWQQLILATTQDGTTTLELQKLAANLRAALLTNQLFLVISNLTQFKASCTILFPSITISDWTFALSPENWRDDTVLILKFAERPLEDLIDDLSLWSAPGAGFHCGPETQAILQQNVADAQKHADLPEFAYFLNTVLKSWNGILFVNCNVPPGQFPPELRGLAAGIDATQFKAHHLGVNLSPAELTGIQISLRDSSLFGLIFYDQTLDLVYQGKPYDFKVLSLRVLFANSQITSFSSQIELLVANLFGERSSLLESLHGDNLILNGVMQKHGGVQSYSFSEEGVDLFEIESKVLDTVLISKAQFVTLPQQAGSNLISTRFLLWGLLQYQQLKDLDLFAFGPSSQRLDSGLRFSNLFVSMAYGTAPGSAGASGQTGPVETSFAFEAGQMVFDLSSSVARPQSLYSRFPLQVTGMLQGDASTMPADLGFIQVDSALTAGSLGDPWFGLQMALSLGSQGSLAAAAGFSATLLAAWAPSRQEYNALIAIRLPGSQGGSKSLTIEGPLKLSIGDIALIHNQDQQAYLMRFANIALSFFSLKFPPGGRTNLLLFGDPDPKGSNTTLGWYAAYQKDASKDSKTSTVIAQPKALLPAPEPVRAARPKQGCGCGD